MRRVPCTVALWVTFAGMTHFDPRTVRVSFRTDDGKSYNLKVPARVLHRMEQQKGSTYPYERDNLLSRLGLAPDALQSMDDLTEA
jgi:hypothetical protein